MSSFDSSGIPRCTIDYSLELSPEEIVSLSGPVNTLLKSSYLIGAPFETAATFESLFDIAEEIAGVEACGLIVPSEYAPGTWEVKASRRIDPSPGPDRLPYLVAPASIVSRFDKAVSMDPEWGPWSAPICETWCSRSLVSFPLRQDRELAGVIVFGKRASHPYSPVQVKLLWALSLQAENHLQRSEAIRALTFYSYLDPLTHLSNRRHFESQLEKEVLRSRRTGKPFSLLMLDIDGFKAYNDRALHASGDIALQEFAGILGACAREVDTVARLGGDDFAVILYESDAEGARVFSDRIIQRFRRHGLPDSSGRRTEQLSASIGVASFPSDTFDRLDLLNKADRALHIAKERGGGRVCLHYETAEPGNGKSSPQELPVRKIFDASRSVVDMDRFLEILLFTGMQGLGATRGSIVVRDSAGEFSLRAAIGFHHQEEHIVSAGAIRPGAVTSWVVDHQVPLVVSVPEDSPVTPPQKKNGYRTHSFLSIPLTHSGRTLGALHITYRKDQRPFTRDDLRAFAPIASEIAGILDQGIRFRENVRSFSLSILSSLSGALELRYPFLSGHFHRVQDISHRVGERMGLGKKDMEALRQAAGFHDVGIIGIPGNLISLKRRLNDRELEMVRKHPFWGAKLLEGVPGMEEARRAILEHHEAFDGSGYPYGLRGGDISLPARILSVAEFYDSVIMDRPHKEGIKREDALRMVEAGSNTHFDPEVAGIFLETEGNAPGSVTDSTH